MYEAKLYKRYPADHYHISHNWRTPQAGVNKTKMFAYLKLIFTLVKQLFVNNSNRSDIDREVTVEEREKLAEKKVCDHELKARYKSH